MATNVKPAPTESGWYPDPSGIPLRWSPAPAGWAPQPPPERGPRRRRALGWPALIAAAVAVVAVAVGLQLTLFSGPVGRILGQGAVAPAGEVWQQVVGQPIDSPQVEAWARSCGMTLPESRNLCHAAGWELGLEPTSMTVERVLLYGVVDSAIQRYQGALPYGLSWDWSVADVTQAWGQPVTVMGGNGTAIQLHYQWSDGYTVVLYLTALHQDPAQIAGAAIHHLEIFRT